MVRPLCYGCKGALKVTIIKPIQHVIMWQAIEPSFGQVLALVAVSLCETLVAQRATATGDGLRVFGNCLSLPSAWFANRIQLLAVISYTGVLRFTVLLTRSIMPPLKTLEKGRPRWTSK